MRLLIGLLLLMMLLTGCNTLKAISETEPAPPSEDSVVRTLCARGSDGQFIFGVILASRADTADTIKAVIKHNDAWRAATKNGSLCSALGAAPFGGVKWGGN